MPLSTWGAIHIARHLHTVPQSKYFLWGGDFFVHPVSSVPITSGGIVLSPRRSDAHIPVLLNKWGASAMSDTWDLAGGAMFPAVRRRELRSNRQESTLQNEPVRHHLRGSGRARSRELPGHPGGHAVESGPAALDRTRLSRTPPRRPGAPPRIPHRRGNPQTGDASPCAKPKLSRPH